MHLWQIFGICGIAFLIFEMFTPSMFFLNFALGAFLCGIVSVFYKNSYGLVIIFFIMSFVSFSFLRPVLIRKLSKETETGVNSKYIGQIVRLDADVTASAGVINIYGERWEARSADGNLIPAGSEVRIVRNESLIMFVENYTR